MRRVDHVEVVGTVDLYELDLGPGGARVRPALGEGHNLVSRAMHEELRHPERGVCERIGDRVAVGDLLGPAAEQVGHRPTPEAGGERGAEISDGSLADRGFRQHRRARPRCAVRKTVAGGRPEREVPARRVTARHDARRVDRIEPCQMVDRSGDVEERPGPAAALLPDAAILDVPGGDSRRGERGCEPGHQRSVPAVAPEAAVDQDDDRKRACAGGQVQIRDVIGMEPVPHRWRNHAANDRARRRVRVMLRLHRREGAGRPARVRWALEEAGATYEYEVMSREEGRTREQERHPLGRVPVLETDDGVLFESAALCLHIADLHPESELIAAPGTHERAEIYQWAFFAMTELEPALIRAYLGRRRDDTEEAAKADARYAKVAGVVAAALDGHDHLVGDRFTIADVVMGGVIESARRYELMPEPAVLHDYLARLDARPAKQRAYTL